MNLKKGFNCTFGFEKGLLNIKRQIIDNELLSLLCDYYSYETNKNDTIQHRCLLYKFSFRSWEKLCVVLKGSQIVFYKDQKTYRSKPEETFRSETPVDLIGGVAEVAADYTKKKHVFRLK